MRSKLGSIVTLSVAGAALAVISVAGTSAAQESATTTTVTSVAAPAEESTTTQPITTTTTTSTTPPTTTTTNTTAPPLVAELPPPPIRVTPSRGTQAQVAETVPQEPTTTTTTTTTLPPPPDDALPANSGSGRRVVYSKSKMRVWTVEADGRVSKTHRVTGRRTWNQPLPGTYSVFSRSAYTCNINSPHICWRYMVRFTKGPEGDNIGFHEIPTNNRTGNKLQSVSQLGQALSAGCVRQATPDAQHMWGWAPIDTQVVVLG